MLQEIDEQATQQEVEALRSKAEKMLDTLNVAIEGGQNADEFGKGRQQLFSHVEALNEQVRQVSINIENLDSGIEATNRRSSSKTIAQE